MQLKYTEKALFSKRHYELREDEIVISGKPTFGSEFEAVIPISTLRKEKDTVRTRTDSKMTLSGIPGVLILIIVIVFSEPIIDVSVYLFYALLALSVIAVGTGFLFSKKKKSYVYHNHSGALAFDIGESGNPIEDFETFCQAIEKKIVAYQGAAHNGGKPPRES